MYKRLSSYNIYEIIVNILHIYVTDECNVHLFIIDIHINIYKYIYIYIYIYIYLIYIKSANYD